MTSWSRLWRRTYGMRTHKLQNQMKSKLWREFKPAPVEAMW